MLAAPAIAQQRVKSGTVNIEQVQVAFGSGNVGSGTLHYEGSNYRFSVGGLGVGGFGVSQDGSLWRRLQSQDLAASSPAPFGAGAHARPRRPGQGRDVAGEHQRRVDRSQDAPPGPRPCRSAPTPSSSISSEAAHGDVQPRPRGRRCRRCRQPPVAQDDVQTFNAFAVVMANGHIVRAGEKQLFASATSKVPCSSRPTRDRSRPAASAAPCRRRSTRPAHDQRLRRLHLHGARWRHRLGRTGLCRLRVGGLPRHLQS